MFFFSLLLFRLMIKGLRVCFRFFLFSAWFKCVLLFPWEDSSLSVFFQFYFSCLYVSLVCLTVDVCDLLVLMYGCGFFYVQFFAGSWYVCFCSIIKLAIILLIQSLLFYPLPGTEELYARSWRGLIGCQTCYCKCGCMYVYVFPMWITGNKRDVFFGSTCFCSFFVDGVVG